MTETENAPPVDMIRDAITNAAAKTEVRTPDPFLEARAAEEQESVAKSDTSAGQAEAEGLQGGVDEPPAGEPGQDAVDSAMAELRRAGLTPDAFKGKSEGALLVAMSEALLTVRKEQDRRIQELRAAQGDSPRTGQPDQDAGATDREAEVALAAQAADRPPVDFSELSSTLTDEMGEEAAQKVTSALKALANDNASLRARLDQDAQARQLEPINRAIDEELSGINDLSNPDARDKFLKMAQAKAEYDGLKAEPGESGADFTRRVVRNALPQREQTAQPKKRVTEAAPEAGRGPVPARKPSTLHEAVAFAADKTFRNR